MSVFVCACLVHMGPGTHRDQRHQLSLELALQVVVGCLMWVLGTKLEFPTEHQCS